MDRRGEPPAAKRTARTDAPEAYAEAMTDRLTKSGQSARTRGALVASARKLFAEHGYENVSAEQIAANAGVTTGALYHQFRNKRDVFRATFEAVEAELTARIALVAQEAANPWDGLQAAAGAFLDAALSHEVRQIILVDGLSVIGWAEWEAMMSAYGLGLTRGALSTLMDAGYIEPLPVDALAHLVLGALNEGVMAIATAPDREKARQEVGVALMAVIGGLRRGDQPPVNFRAAQD